MEEKSWKEKSWKEMDGWEKAGVIALGGVAVVLWLVAKALEHTSL